MECLSQSSALTSLPKIAKPQTSNFASEVTATQMLELTVSLLFIHTLQAQALLLQLAYLSQFATTIAIWWN
jgi:hypothetical protein